MPVSRFWPLLVVLAACARPAPPASPVPAGVGSVPTPEHRYVLPPVPRVEGPLALTVVYPPAGSAIDAGDSSFVFGSAGTGAATVTVNGAPVRVWPNGAWLAWIQLPGDSVIRLDVVARAGAESTSTVHEVRRVRRFRPSGSLWVDTTSFEPSGRVWWPRDEALSLSVRASEDAELRLHLSDGRVIAFAAAPSPGSVPQAIRAFDRDTQNLVRPANRQRYFASIEGTAIGVSPGPLMGRENGHLPGSDPVLEAIRGRDTLRVRWPIRVALLEGPQPVVELNDDPDARGGTDRITVGRAMPAGTYHWFFPTGTRAPASGRINGDLRLRLSAASVAWVAVGEAGALPFGAGEPASVGSVTATPRERWVDLRIPVTARVPYQVEETVSGVRIRLYGAVGDPNWIRYGSTTGMLDRITWRQAAADEVEFEVGLSEPLWGYRVRWERNDLLLQLRPRPAIDHKRPLQGRLIVVDPGHPPAGAIGPTGLKEPDANLGVALALEEMLRLEGARVVLTRRDGFPIDLWPRVNLADSLDADLLISIHNNALPDGVNPFRNNGSSVFYFRPPSIPLARAVQRELVSHLGLRDLGIARGDLALVRGTWMPSVLTEGLFMMLPDQEAALRSSEGRHLYAEAVLEGIRHFLAGDGL